MKKTILYILTLYAALSMYSFSGGFGNPATGAPGESGASCGQAGCHAAGAFSVALDVTMADSDGNLVEEYLPGETYTIGLKINHSGLPTGYGFQMVCLQDEGNAAINNFSDLPNGTKVLTALEREYISHAQRLALDSIPLTWTAPEKETGSITFYAGANAVNGNGSPAGDGSATGSFTFAEALGSSTSDIDKLDLDIYPNPTTDIITIPGNILVKELDVVSLQGVTVKSSKSNSISIAELTNGNYVVRVLDRTGQRYSELIQKI